MTVEPLRYHAPLSPDDFAYFHVQPRTSLDAQHVNATVIEPALRETEDRFGIQVRPLRWGSVPDIGDKVLYCLVGPLNPLELYEEERAYLAQLATMPHARVNIAPIFPYLPAGDTQAYQEGATGIPEQDRQLGVNTIFADDTDGLYFGRRTVTSADVVDNTVCETIRLKYRAVHDVSQQGTEALQEAHKEAAEDITAISRIFKEYGLWHRSETDGAFMVHTDKGWLVTQTKTDKTQAGPANTSLIREYSAAANTVTYAGRKLPSPDAPEFLVAGDYLRTALKPSQNIRLAVHFHHNPTTRSDNFPELRTPIIEYGLFESGQAILDTMKQKGDNGLILTEHGVIWFGSSAEELERYVAERLGIPKVLAEQ